MKLKFKIDENIPLEIKDLLNDKDFICDSVYDEKLEGKTDSEVMAKCILENRILISLDLDFSDIRTYPPKSISGIIVLKPKSQDKNKVIQMVEKIIPYFNNEKLYHHLWIVDQNKIRIRGDE